MEKRKLTAKDAIKRNKYLKTVLEHFWKRWSSEYLTQLREHRKSSQKHGPVLNVGDLVRAETKALIGEGCIFIYSRSARRISFEINGNDN